MAGTIKQVFIFFIVTISINLLAETLYDPTRPAPQFLAKSRNKLENDSTFVLQSILLSLLNKAAIINGQHVRIGELIEGHKLQSLTANQATLKSPEGICILELVPSVRVPATIKNCNLQGDS